MTDTVQGDLDRLSKAGLVLLALQIAIFAELWIRTGFDAASEGFPILMVATGIFVGGQRTISAHPPNRGAGRWIDASRIAALSLMALGTFATGYLRLFPGAGPVPAVVPQLLFALVWVIIALKGAAMGKLRPGSRIGLRVSWTRQSRLAWDRGHRALGRVLFWGGLIGLATSLVVAPPVTFAMWFGTLALAMATSLFVSWRTWLMDPERSG